MAFESNKTGRDEIVVRPFPNTLDGMWQVSSDGGRMPVWAHSGNELFYLNGEGDIITVEVRQSNDAISFGERDVLFSASQFFITSLNGHHFDITPDDLRFVFVGAVGGRSALELIVVENFFEELKAKVGN